MRSYAEVLAELYLKNGGNKAEIARKLGGKVSPQVLGQYEIGRHQPKLAFIKRWKEVFGDDLTALTETNASRQTFSDPVKTMPMDVWDELKENNETFKEEINRLWALVNRLTTNEPRQAQKG